MDIASDEGRFTDERWILAATILASSMAFIDGSALNVAIPALQASLNASGAELLWVLNAYLLMLAALILVGGSLGDRWGRKKVFMAGIGLFILASMASGLSPSIQWMIAARVVQGIGGALMIPGSLAIINATVAADRRGRAIGTWSATTTLVTVAGPLLGGVLSDHSLWRGVFLINFPLGLASLVVLYYKVPETRDETVSGPIDIAGAVLVTLGLAGIAYGSISASSDGLSDPRVYGTLILGLIALAGFVWVEMRRKSAMMPLFLFGSRTFAGTNLLTLFLYGALSVGTFFLSLNLIQAQGYSKTEAGLAFLPFSILLILMSRWAGGLADRIGPRLPLILGPTLVGAGFLWLAIPGVTQGPSEYWTSFLPGTILFGIGMGFTVAPLSSTVMGSVARNYSGTASGINNAVSRTAGVLTIAIVGSIALVVFGSSLQEHTSQLALSPEAQASLQVEAQNLGETSVPSQVAPSQAAAVADSIHLAFVGTFRLVALICAGMAWLSALLAAILVEKKLP
ncbi:MAG: MFS transporter [Chloroflexi bacterium]|nr:MFS transporter [Chloroflexota bacterium]